MPEVGELANVCSHSPSGCPAWADWDSMPSTKCCPNRPQFCEDVPLLTGMKQNPK